MARSLGIKGRDVSLLLSEESNGLNGKDFVKWLSNLTIEEIDKLDISKFDKENVQDISLKLTPNSYREIPSSFSFNIKGIYFSEERKIASKLINEDDTLKYERDQKNNYDPYAIKILINDNELGFVPR